MQVDADRFTVSVSCCIITDMQNTQSSASIPNAEGSGSVRKRIYEVIEVSFDGDNASTVYDVIMLVAIVLSVVPLAFKDYYFFFYVTDIATTVLFIADYILRWLTADYKLAGRSRYPFVRYPFTSWAIIDLISILPTISVLNNSFRLLRLIRFARTVRIIRTFRLFRVFKLMRYSRSMSIIMQVIHNSRDALFAVFNLAAAYVLVSALVVFSVESESFETFFDAVYWATVSLTTVGYGDIYPVTTAGRIVTMLSSVFGIAVVALPAGIITAGYMSAIQSQKGRGEDTSSSEQQRAGEALPEEKPGPEGSGDIHS